MSNSAGASQDNEPGYGQLFSVLLRRSPLILGVLCCVIPLAMFLSLKKEPSYKSSMVFLVEPTYRERNDSSASAVAEDRFSNSGLPDEVYATQIKVMQSSEVLGKALGALQREEPLTSLEKLQKSLAISRVEGRKSDEKTNLLRVDYTSSDPAKSQKVLQALQQVYLAYNLEQQRVRISKGLAFIDEQLPVTSNQVEDTEQLLQEFRKRQNVIDPEKHAEEISQTLAKIVEDQKTVQAQYQDTLARYKNLQQQLAQSPQGAVVASRLSQSKRYQELLGQIQKTQIALAETRAQYTSVHPAVNQLERKLQNQQSLLKEEARGVLGALPAGSTFDESTLRSQQELSQVDLQLAGNLTTAQTELEGLRARYNSLIQQEKQLRSELNRFPTLITQYNRLQPEIKTKRDTLEQLLKARQELAIDLARRGYNWQVIESPQPGLKTGPNVKADLLLGAVVGLFLGGLAAFAREASDDVIHDSEQLRQIADLPVLGTIPKLPQLETGISLLPFNASRPTPLLIPSAINSPLFRDAMDQIYQTTQLSLSNAPLKSLAITSALPNEGKSLLASGLALSAARLHQRVLLIDANLRSPSLHYQFNLPNEQGLSTFLEEKSAVSAEKVIQASNVEPNLSILTAGPLPVDPAKLLSSLEFKDLIAELEAAYDLVIVDTTSVFGRVDAISTANNCSHTLLVASINQVTQTALRETMNSLNQLNVIGILANGGKGLTTIPKVNKLQLTSSAQRISASSPLPLANQ